MCEAAPTSAAAASAASAASGNGSGEAVAAEASASYRPKLYKIRDDLNQYYELVNEHLVSSYIYDIYLELKPNTFRQIHAFALGVGKLARLIFLYFLFYHTIWYFPLNKDRRNSPLNTTYLDPYLAMIVLYLNFYHTIIHKFVVKCLIDELIRTMRSISTNKARVVVYLIEMLIYAAIDVYLVYVMRVHCALKMHACIGLLLPHVAFKINRYFHLNVTLFGWCVYKNKYTRESLGVESCVNGTGLQASSAANNVGVDRQAADGSIGSNSSASGKYVYNDCSNLTMANYLSKKICMPSLYLSTNAFGSSKAGVEDPFKVKHTMLSHHYRSIKSSQTKAKLYSVLMNSALNRPIRFLMNLLKRGVNALARVGDLFKTCTCSYKTPNQRYYTNAMHPNQSASTGTCYWTNTILLSDQVQHRCEREATSVRDEAETFMCDFYARLNRVVSCTLETVFYSLLVVRLHVPTALHVKDFHFFLYLLAMTFSLFATYFVYHIPFSVVITNKRCAQHLGKWVLDDEYNNNKATKQRQNSQQQQQSQSQTATSTAINRWQPSKIYFRGDRVQYGGKVYRVASQYCASIPSVRFYTTYYRLFKEPTLFYASLLLFKIIGISLMVGYLIYNRLWYSIIMNMIELGTNFISYYVIMRDLIYLTGISRPKMLTIEVNNSNSLKKAQ